MPTTTTNYTSVTIDIPDSPSATLTFTLLSTVISGTEVIDKGEAYSVTLDGDGIGSINLPTPDATGIGASLYRVVLPNGERHVVSVAYNASAQTLAALLAAGVTGQTADAITTLLSAYVPRVSSGDNAIARFDGTNGALQNSTASISDAGVLTSGSIVAATGEFDTVNTDQIDESGSGVGVTIETVLIRDGAVDGRDVSADGTTLDALRAVTWQSKTTDYEIESSDNLTGLRVTGTTTIALAKGLATGFRLYILSESGTTTLTSSGNGSAPGGTTLTAYTSVTVTGLVTALHVGSDLWLIVGDYE